MREILFVAGEVSGDLHASGVARELKARNASFRLSGIGGDEMKAEGVELVEHVEKLAVMGFIEVLEHIPSPGRALAEMRRVVADGGVAVVSVPNERLINTLKAMLRRSGLYRLLLVGRSGDYEMPERMDDEWHLHVFDLAGLLAMIPRGLRVTRVEGIPFRWLPLRYVVRCESDGRDDEHRASG